MPKKQPLLKNKLVIASLIALIIISIFTAIQYSKAKNEGMHFTRQIYPIRAVIEFHRNLGITDNRSLDFPRIPIGTAVTREVLLNNIYGFRVRVVPSAQGNVTPYIISSMEPVYLEIGELRKFNVTIHGRAKPGNYSGNLTLDLYKLI